jgi:pimeloyl-ACP methyl ester carboxylesterase
MTESERRGLSKKLEDDAFFEAFIDRFWTQKTTPEIRKEVNSTMLSAAKHMRCNATTMAGVAHAWRSDEIYELPALHLASMMDKVGIDPAWFRHVPKLEMQVWNENGHFLFMEEPEQVNAAVKAFVEAFKLMAASTQ